MSPFPLFRLPLLPLKIVLDNMHPGDPTLLSFLSKKSRELLKLLKQPVSLTLVSYPQKRKLNVLEMLDLFRLEIKNNGSINCFPEDSISISILITDKIEIKLRASNENKYAYCFPLLIYAESIKKLNRCEGKKGKLVISGKSAPVIMADDWKLYTFWDDQSNGLKILVEYIKEFFNAQAINYFFYESSDSKFSKNLRTAVKGLAQQTTYICVIHRKISKPKDYKFILDNIKPTIRFLQNHSSSSNNTFRHKTKFTSKYLKLDPADWFTLDNLMKTDCEHITLIKSQLTNADMYKYLKLWMDGKLSKLKHLIVELKESIDLNYIHFKLQKRLEKFGYTMSRRHFFVDVISIKEHDKTIAAISKEFKLLSQNVFEFYILENPFNN